MELANLRKTTLGSEPSVRAPEKDEVIVIPRPHADEEEERSHNHLVKRLSPAAGDRRLVANLLCVVELRMCERSVGVKLADY